MENLVLKNFSVKNISVKNPVPFRNTDFFRNFFERKKN